MITLNNLYEVCTHTHRKNIKIGSTVLVIEKKNYKNGKLTKGKVKKILTNKRNHPRGIKVMLDDGTVGRVQDIL